MYADWTLMAWTPREWFMEWGNLEGRRVLHELWGLGEMPGAPVPAPMLVVNVAGEGGEGIDWAKVKVPAGVKVVDGRATRAGYARADGSVVRGDVYDLMTSKPVGGAKVIVEKGPEYVPVTMEADARGHFEIKHLAGTYRISVGGAGYVTRVVFNGSIRVNTLREVETRLAAPKKIVGMVTDEAGKAMTGVEVEANTAVGVDGRPYVMMEKQRGVTDGEGKFEMTMVEGSVRILARAKGWRQMEGFRVYEVPTRGEAGARIVMEGVGVGD